MGEPDVLYRYWLEMEEVEINGSRNEYRPVSGQLSCVGSGVEGNRSLFLPLVCQGQAGELAAPAEDASPTKAEPPAESNGPAPVLLPQVSR